MLSEFKHRLEGSRFRKAILPMTAAILLGAFFGCGKSNPVAQVSGKVVFKNGAMPPAGVRVVRLEPTADSNTAVRKGASGTISDDGTFEIFTRRPGDGVHFGNYAVTFAFWKSVTDHTSLIAPRYMDAKNTPYHLTVDKNMVGLEYQLEQANAASR
jgi:hypothetical protein